MNISVVAREAGISASSIHNTYPDLAEAIRVKAAKGSGSRLDAELRARRQLLEQLRRARERLKIADQEVLRIASENARLVTENSLLRARLSSRNLISLTPTSRSARSTSSAWQCR